MPYYERDFTFWLTNVIGWSLIFYFAKKINAHNQLLEWFGRHALLWYVVHWLFIGIITVIIQ